MGLKRSTWGAFLALFASIVLSSVTADAAECTLLRIDAAKGAELLVYFTRFESEDQTQGKYKRCRLVRKAREGTKSFFVTPFRKDANVIVHESNWPR